MKTISRQWNGYHPPTTTKKPAHKAWSQFQLLSSCGFISGHWNQAKADISVLSAPLVEDTARDAARSSAIQHLDIMRLALDELSKELKTQQQQPHE